MTVVEVAARTCRAAQSLLSAKNGLELLLSKLRAALAAQSGCNPNIGVNAGGGAGGTGVFRCVVYTAKTWSGSYDLSGGAAGGHAYPAYGGNGGDAGNTGVYYEIGRAI